MEKCFLLGAGASTGYKNSYSNDRERPPGSAEIFQRGLELNILDERFSGLRETLQSYASENGYSQSIWEYDVEKVLKYSIREEEFANYGQLTSYIYELFRYYSKNYNHSGADNYQKLANHYRDSQYSVISLNYDILFEQALGSRGFGFSYEGIQSRDIVPISKIHGSINIANRFPPQLVSSTQPFPVRADTIYNITVDNIALKTDQGTIELPDTKYADITTILETNCEELVPKDDITYQTVLVPPIGKNKLTEQGLHRVDNELVRMEAYAKKLLQDANELVIIGSQVREDDEDLRRLMRENLNGDSTITLVCGTSTSGIKSRLREDMGEIKINDTGQYFGPYVDSL